MSSVCIVVREFAGVSAYGLCVLLGVQRAHGNEDLETHCTGALSLWREGLIRLNTRAPGAPAQDRLRLGLAWEAGSRHLNQVQLGEEAHALGYDAGRGTALLGHVVDGRLQVVEQLVLQKEEEEGEEEEEEEEEWEEE